MQGQHHFGTTQGRWGATRGQPLPGPPAPASAQGPATALPDAAGAGVAAASASPHCMVADLSDTRLTLHADNASFATRLQFETPKLRARLLQLEDFATITDIRVRAAPQPVVTSAPPAASGAAPPPTARPSGPPSREHLRRGAAGKHQAPGPRLPHPVGATLVVARVRRSGSRVRAVGATLVVPRVDRGAILWSPCPPVGVSRAGCRGDPCGRPCRSHRNHSLQ